MTLFQDQLSKSVDKELTAKGNEWLGAWEARLDELREVSRP